jgi:hypothetical protein
MTTSIVVTESIELTRTKAPALPYAPVQYDRAYVDGLTNILRQYFNTLDNFVAQLNLSAGGSGAGLFLPYGSFCDTTDQTAASTTTAYAVAFNTTELSSGVTLSNTSRLNVTNAGIYNVQFSLQFKNTDNDGHDVDVWLRKNGTNIANSNSRFHIPARKSAGDPSHLIAALNIFVDMTAGQYVEIMWKVGNVAVSLEHYPTSTTPTRPAVPSAIATLSFVSAV